MHISEVTSFGAHIKLSKIYYDIERNRNGCTEKHCSGRGSSSLEGDGHSWMQAAKCWTESQ